MMTNQQPFLCPVYFRNVPSQLNYDYQTPVYQNQIPAQYATNQYPNQYMPRQASKDAILDEILSSLYMHLPQEVYEDYASTILACVFENDNKSKVIDDENREITYIDDNMKMLNLFLDSKRVEGLSENTLKHYKYAITKVLDFVSKNYAEVTSADIRHYMSQYKKTGVSNVSVNNLRLILSSFYGWLEAEDYILKSPMRRINKIKMDKVIKEIITEENIELLRIACKNVRDLAIIDTLFSTGCRLAEMQRMNRSDIDFTRNSMIVFGKGSKEREVYLNAKARVNIKRYLNERCDNNDALWVGLKPPHNRLSNRGIQEIIDKVQKDAGISQNIHPHMFRRTAATVALQRGMSLETIQMMLGHSSIETTMHYVIVDKQSVKAAHDRYLN
jgi:site-specific recombinase XerD